LTKQLVKKGEREEGEYAWGERRKRKTQQDVTTNCVKNETSSNKKIYTPKALRRAGSGRRKKIRDDS
jgi:hypothetical protein